MTKDIGDRFEAAHTNTILKASKLIPLSTGVTIGPYAVIKNEYYEVQDEYSVFEEGKEAQEIDEMICNEPENTPTSVPVAVALQELEELRKEEVKDSVNRYVQQITSFEQQLQNKMNEELNSLRDEMNAKSRLKEKLIESRITDDDLPISKAISDLLNKCQLEKQLSKKEKAEEEKKLQAQKEDEIRLKSVRIQTIQNINANYLEILTDVIENMKECKDSQKLNNKMQANVNELVILRGELNVILVKTSNLDDKDVVTCNMILQRAIQISNKLKEVIDEINKEYEIELEKQKANAPSEILNDIQVENSVLQKSQDEDECSTLDKCICKESYETYKKLKKNFDEMNGRLKSVSKTKNTKEFILLLKIAINTPINAMSSLSADHMRDKYNKIIQLLGGNFKYPSSKVEPEMRNLYYPFCIDFLCKKFISQGENLTPAKPEDAFSLGSLIVSLWINYPDFGELLLSYFMVKCPYIIPAYWPQFKDQTDKEYYTSLGYRYNDEDVIEDHNMFLKRMTGILMLYTAIILSEPRYYKPHPHGIKNAWRWLAAALNLEPSPDITATLIHEFLKIAGFKLSRIYGLQFWKLIHFLYSEYYLKIDKITSDDFRGPLSRLKEFLENVLKTRKFPEPRGLLPSTYW